MKKLSPRPDLHPSPGGRKNRPAARLVDIGEQPSPPPSKNAIFLRLIAGAVVLAAGLWAYYPTLKEMVTTWQKEPDYSHGFLVVPVSLFYLWSNRKSFPGFGPGAWVLGSLLVACSLALRLFAGAYYFESVDGWSMLFWLAGCVAILVGSAALRWSWPAIAFLVFMVPLPFRVESMLSLPLQRIATKISCGALQIMGQPAIAEGNTILLGDNHLEVEQACSGLRLFVSILALAFVYFMFVRRAWWEKALLLASVVPIAIVANSARIVFTGLLFEFVSSETAKHFSHDFAGWAMIPLAASLFWIVLWYLSQLFREQDEVDIGSLVRRVDI